MIMRLIYFIPLLSTVGGQERTLTDKANWLTANGHEVMFVTYEHEGPLAYQLKDGIRHLDIHCHYFDLYKCSVWRRPYELLRLKHHFRKKMADVVASFCPDIIIVPVPNTENFLWDLMKVAHSIPVVIESHLAYGHSVNKRGLTEKWLYYLENPLHAIRNARLLIALTEGDAICWRRNLVKNVKVVPNPVTCYPESVFPISKTEGRIICVGRYTQQKRFDRLIDAFGFIANRYPNWCVDIFGDGEEKENLNNRIVEKGLTERIHLLPPTHDIYAEYQRSQFFVLSSDFEGFGLVIIEAMACGIPVVASDCPFGPSEIIEDGKTGLLAKMEVADLAAKMEWMITHDAERRQMGQNARQAAARYRLDRVMPEWERAYLSVLE